jgi:hypothetical protein
MVKIKKVILVAGKCGARMDFVAGWLGTLPLFLDNEWHIDPLTGQSYGFMRHTKMLDSKKIDSFSNLFRGHFIIDPAAELCYAGSLHAARPDNIQDAVNSGQAELLIIDTSAELVSNIYWECMVKTFLSQLRTRQAINLWNRPWQIDLTINKNGMIPNINDVGITNSDRIALVKQQLHKEITIHYSTSMPIIDMPHKKVDYNLLFQPGGSKYLCNTLGLPDVNERYHNFWDQQLPLSKSPDSLVVRGETWNKADYFND